MHWNSSLSGGLVAIVPPANGRRGCAIVLAERCIESPDAAEPRCKSDSSDGQICFGQQLFCEKDFLGSGQTFGRSADMGLKQSAQVTTAHTKLRGQVLQAPFIQRTLTDQQHGPGNRGGCTVPGRTARCCLGPASETRTQAGFSRCSRGRKVDDVLRLRRTRRAYGPAINTGAQNTCEKQAVESRVPRQPRPLADPRDQVSCL